VKYWQQRAKTNVEMIEHLTSMPQFQSLTKLLLANRGHRTGADVLIAFNQEMASKDKLIAGWYGKPYSFYASLEHMQKTYGKSNKTWQNWKCLLTAFGLLRIIRPKSKEQWHMSEKEWRFKRSRLQSKAAFKSLARARQKTEQADANGRHILHEPVHHFFIPEYTNDVLVEANRRAQLWIESGQPISSVSESVIAYVYGEKEAQRTYDYLWQMSSSEAIVRELLVKNTKLYVGKNGYCKPAQVIGAVQNTLRHTRYGYEYSYGYIERVWQKANRQILRENGMTYKTPTKAQKAMYGLKNGQFIITRATPDQPSSDTQ
jgi:hypothetical protein